MTTLKIILAIIVGFLAGSAMNMALVALGGQIMAPPPGVDLTDMRAIQAAMPTLEAKYFLFPFLAHALGTLVGAFLAYLIAPPGAKWVTWVIGIMFLAGGIAASAMIPAPKWFLVADLALAYLPMAWIGARIGAALKPGRVHVG